MQVEFICRKKQNFTTHQELSWNNELGYKYFSIFFNRMGLWSLVLSYALPSIEPCSASHPSMRISHDAAFCSTQYLHKVCDHCSILGTCRPFSLEKHTFMAMYFVNKVLILGLSLAAPARPGFYQLVH